MKRKEQDIHQNALYQRFLDELEPGAQEYDRIMANGENSGASRAGVHIMYKYAAAACLLFAVSAAAWMLWRTDRPYETQQLAQKVETRPAPPKRHEVQMPEGQDEKVAESHRYEKSAVMPRQRNLLTQETEQEMEESLQDASDAQADCFGEETNKMAELKEQVEAELQRELLERYISMEVVETALKEMEESYQSYQIQCSI